MPWAIPIHIIHFLLSISYNQSENRRLIGGTIIVQKLTYTQYGDYHNPDIRLAHTGTQTLGKYGRMRKAFLEQNNPMCFNDMVLTETLFSHLWEVQQICEKRMKLLMEDLLAKNPAPDKATQQLEWVLIWTALKHRQRKSSSKNWFMRRRLYESAWRILVRKYRAN